MSFIIAIILVIVVWILMSNDKTKTVAYERKRDKKKASIEEWENLYVDEELEKKLISCISEKENYATVYEEVSKTIANMEHWKYLLDTGFPLNEDQIDKAVNERRALEEIGRNKSIALDIMLANRGKVSWHSSAYGYAASVIRGAKSLKEAQYEYAETILNIMRSRGAQVELFYINSSGSEHYGWVGSSLERLRNDSFSTVKEFSRLFFQFSSVPPIE